MGGQKVCRTLILLYKEEEIQRAAYESKFRHDCIIQQWKYMYGKAFRHAIIVSQGTKWPRKEVRKKISKWS